MDMLTAKSPLRAADAQTTTPARAVAPGLPCVRSDSLFGRSREILIEHGGSYYRLRLTHSNKLILTK